MVTRGVLASGDVTIKKKFHFNISFCFLCFLFLNYLIELFEVIHAFFIKKTVYDRSHKESY